ncbi:MAG: AzlD domain-containing protein [Dehalococcoidales bacterium]|jgi:branched-subunit amino acid transport protein|nr:AzlD domain-containing protein [Dehalococcoidales bacterium]MDD4322990.1 AzlD domain-containing protein [Dehalococcoidales bacterium]MDD4794668.1 AzlD domain-containing protein [Dehalococcoidales bacterium]MDD5122141.1 AzlD domain-containing protein [Dehalococcoidales bacterium]MDD5498847.1 AzlD domain-containing protein [Dehalococcoidales bacterium]
MSVPEYLLLLLGMSLVTYIPRWIPLVVLSGRKLPDWLVEWLDLIPVAILSALLFPLLVMPEEGGAVNLIQPELIAALPTAVIALKLRSLSITVIAGMLIFWAVSLFF